MENYTNRWLSANRGLVRSLIRIQKKHNCDIDVALATVNFDFRDYGLERPLNQEQRRALRKAVVEREV